MLGTCALGYARHSTHRDESCRSFLEELKNLGEKTDPTHSCVRSSMWREYIKTAGPERYDVTVLPPPRALHSLAAPNPALARPRSYPTRSNLGPEDCAHLHPPSSFFMWQKLIPLHVSRPNSEKPSCLSWWL